MILIYVNSSNGLSKAALETVTYAKKLGNEVVVLTNGKASSEILTCLGEYGATKVLVDRMVDGEDPQQLTRLISAVVQNIGAKTVIFSHDLIGKAVAPRLSVRLQAGLIAGAISIPDTDGAVKVNVFSGKAIGNVKVSSAIKIISLLPNSIQPEKTGANCLVEETNGLGGAAAIKVISTKKPEGEILLPEAELVVSAGRGLKAQKIGE